MDRPELSTRLVMHARRQGGGIRVDVVLADGHATPFAVVRDSAEGTKRLVRYGAVVDTVAYLTQEPLEEVELDSRTDLKAWILDRLEAHDG